MALYEYGCLGHRIEAHFPMGQAPAIVPCFEHRTDAVRILGNFNTQEDRYRFFKNPQDGTTFSYAFGCEHPDNRRDYNELTDRLGCEPVTPGTMPTQWKEDREYAEHVRNGGERLKNDGAVFKAGNETVLSQLKKSGITIP